LSLSALSQCQSISLFLSLSLSRLTVSPSILNRPTTASGGHSRPWTIFSGSAFRHVIFDVVSYRGRSRHHNRHYEEDKVFVSRVRSTAKALEKVKAVRSEKLSDLLRMADSPKGQERRGDPPILRLPRSMRRYVMLNLGIGNDL
jgi:hypothetical protein